MLFSRIQQWFYLILFLLFVCNSYIINNDRFYFSPISNATIFRTFSQVSLSRCIYECKIRLRCDAINYRNEWKLCALIREPWVLSGVSTKNIAVGQKSEWLMVIILIYIFYFLKQKWRRQKNCGFLCIRVKTLT